MGNNPIKLIKAPDVHSGLELFGNAYETFNKHFEEMKLRCAVVLMMSEDGDPHYVATEGTLNSDALYMTEFFKKEIMKDEDD